MPTEISYQKTNGFVEQIGFCLESPVEVLRMVARTHDIVKYRGIERPVYRKHDSPKNPGEYDLKPTGLIIAEGIPPRGTGVTGGIGDLSLEIARDASHRVPSGYSLALWGAIGCTLDTFSGNSTVDGPAPNYLNVRERTRIPRFEERLEIILEIARTVSEDNTIGSEELKIFFNREKETLGNFYHK